MTATGDVVIETVDEGTDEIRVSGLASLTLAENVEVLTHTGTGPFTGTGNTLANTFSGAVGVETFVGLAGDDVYVVGDGDLVVEAAGEGRDEIHTSLLNYSLAAVTGVEDLLFTGTGDFTGAGNDLDNTITGGAGNDSLVGGAGHDTLHGGTGNDVMTGGLGNDVFVVDSSGDSVVEFAGEGTDEIRTTLLSYTLGANPEKLTYSGRGNFTGIGNTLNNTLTGGIGNDTLDGGSGADVMAGGGGDDSYVVGAAGDVVTELADAGIDTVRTTLSSYALGANVENLSYLGAAAFVGTGNSLDNELAGGTGVDSFFGGSGNDTYLLNSAGDQAFEQANEGVDSVQTNLVSFVLGANLENLVYTGTVSFTGTGNALDNLISGGSKDDTLDGGLGVDRLTGGAGNDTYFIDNAGDVVIENGSEGKDEIRTTLSIYALKANLENLTYLGTGPFAGTGNSGANTIKGGSGNDILDGRGGADTLIGGAGDDIYIVDNAGDVVTEATKIAQPCVWIFGTAWFRHPVSSS